MKVCYCDNSARRRLLYYKLPRDEANCLTTFKPRMIPTNFDVKIVLFYTADLDYSPIYKPGLGIPRFNIVCSVSFNTKDMGHVAFSVYEDLSQVHMQKCFLANRLPGNSGFVSKNISLIFILKR